MALIKCPECGKEISDRAAACPNCGFPIASKDIDNSVIIKIELKESDNEIVFFDSSNNKELGRGRKNSSIKFEVSGPTTISAAACIFHKAGKQVVVGKVLPGHRYVLYEKKAIRYKIETYYIQL